MSNCLNWFGISESRETSGVKLKNVLSSISENLEAESSLVSNFIKCSNFRSHLALKLCNLRIYESLHQSGVSGIKIQPFSVRTLKSYQFHISTWPVIESLRAVHGPFPKHFCTSLTLSSTNKCKVDCILTLNQHILTKVKD